MDIKGKWMYNTGDEENWACEDGEFDTREEAIKFGKEFFLNPSDDYLDSIMTDIEDYQPSSFDVGLISEVELKVKPWNVIDDAQEQAGEQAGEWSERWLSVIKMEDAELLSKMLTEAFWKWTKETNNGTTFFTMTKVEEILL